VEKRDGLTVPQERRVWGSVPPLQGCSPPQRADAARVAAHEALQFINVAPCNEVRQHLKDGTGTTIERRLRKHLVAAAQAVQQLLIHRPKPAEAGRAGCHMAAMLRPPALPYLPELFASAAAYRRTRERCFS
jgi:hypothetical protein